MKIIDYKNYFAAICIPFNSDYSLNEPELRRYIRWLSSLKHIDGLVCNGHTGEITSLSPSERAEVTSVVADETGDKSVIVSGICTEGTLEAIRHARDAKSAGADAILLMPPHVWLRFGMNPEAPYEYFRRVAETVDIDIIIHLYPYSTKAFYPVETVLKIASLPNVKALKIGTRQMAVYEKDIRILRREAPELRILTCHDEYLLSSMYVGVDGALVGFAGCIPELLADAWQAVLDGDFAKTRRLQDKIFPMADAIYGIGQPSGEAHARMKEALYQRGLFSSALMREPVIALPDSDKNKIKEALREAGKYGRPVVI